MSNKYPITIVAVGFLMAGLACDKPSGSSSAQSDARQTPAPHHETSPTTTATPHRAAEADDALRLSGLTLTVPDGWQRGKIAPGPFAAVAVFDLTRGDADEDHAQVRITHFPGMKGKDDMNIQRWLGQVAKDDGSSYSLDEANLNVSESGNVRITTIDVEGSVKATMRATPRPNSRMIAAIIDHPKGPHFVVATGSVAAMKNFEAGIQQFLKSATVASP